MKFDTIIIGGGLTGLLCGIRLQRKGQKCAVISAGQSAMHFWSGAFDLLNRMPDGTDVDYPLESIGKLPQTHPYSIIGADKVLGHLRRATELFGILDSGHISPKVSATYTGSVQWAPSGAAS